MTSRLLALTITAALSLGVAGSASAASGAGIGYSKFGTWDATHTYAVNGKKRTCTLTRGAKCVGARLRGKVKHHGDLRKANLRRADLRGANLKGARFQYAAPVHGKKAKRSNQTPSCAPKCEGANLIGAFFRGAVLKGALLTGATWGNTTCPDRSVTSTGCPT